MPQPYVYFYLPQSLWPDDLPDDVSLNWPGFGLGVYAWTVQTYLRLRDAGLSCALVNYLPSEGIVFLHRNTFRNHRSGIEMSPKRLLVCFQGDLPPHPDAQIHIVQNRTQHQLKTSLIPNWLWKQVEESHQLGAYFMPHWPQPGLRPREIARGNRFTTIAFFGHTTNLAPELSGTAWGEALDNLGLQWRPVINTNQWNKHQTLDVRWDDYGSVDAIVAVRTFDKRALAQANYYQHKPATKLYNAWLAGVPAILGVESGYRAERQNSLDYIEAQSLAEVLQALVQLKEDHDLRQAMINHGRAKAQAVSPEKLTQRWLRFVQDTLLPLYEIWCRQSPLQQQLVRYHNHLSYGAQRLQERFHNWQYSLNQD